MLRPSKYSTTTVTVTSLDCNVFSKEKMSSKKMRFRDMRGNQKLALLMRGEGKEAGTRRIDDQTILHYACIN